jgi:DNA-directed RNA polymerase specialized sigma24 family protein
MSTDLSSAEAREARFIRLYETVFPAVARYVRRKGGNSDAARDIFQDALVVYYEKTVAGDAAIHTSEAAYIFGIARHFWSKKYASDTKTTSSDRLLFAAEEPEEHPSVERLTRYLEKAGRKCMQLLQSFYYHRLNMQEIAGQFGFSGERSATVQKHKCIEKLRAEVKQKALTYSDFYE